MKHVHRQALERQHLAHYHLLVALLLEHRIGARVIKQLLPVHIAQPADPEYRSAGRSSRDLPRGHHPIRIGTPAEDDQRPNQQQHK